MHSNQQLTNGLVISSIWWVYKCVTYTVAAELYAEGWSTGLNLVVLWNFHTLVNTFMCSTSDQLRVVWNVLIDSLMNQALDCLRCHSDRATSDRLMSHIITTSMQGTDSHACHWVLNIVEMNSLMCWWVFVSFPCPVAVLCHYVDNWLPKSWTNDTTYDTTISTCFLQIFLLFACRRVKPAKGQKCCQFIHFL